MAPTKKKYDDELSDDDVSLAVSSLASRTTRNSASNRNNRSSSSNMTLAVEEQKRVQRMKVVMLGALLVFAFAMGIATFFIIRDGEEQTFQREFESYSSEIVAVTTEHVQSSIQSIEAFANSITSYASSTGMTWPNVTIPDYTSRAIRLADLAADSRLVTMAPFVTNEDKLGFEAYAKGVIHEQIQQDLDYQGITDVNATDLEGIPQVISYFNLSARQKFVEPPNSPFNPYLVNWQRYPFETPKNRIFVMNNMMRIPTIRNAVTQARITGQAAATFFEAILGVESQIIQPIFDKVLPPGSNETKSIVGVVWVVLSWARYFQNLLPDSGSGIYVVLKSSCGFITTFLVKGLVAEELGLGDHHDPKYNDMEIQYDFVNFNPLDGTEVPEDVCIDKLTLFLYPSDELKANYTSNNPWYYMAAVLGIFLLTSVTFLIFDWTVRAREQKVMDRVKLQDKIVSNLFPSTFKDRLYHINDDNADAMSDLNGSVGSTLTFGSTGAKRKAQRLLERDLDNPEALRGKPIADLFLETTVFFGDISGFTSWSSVREPAQVLTLLENLYGAFDKIARRHFVFKVETIGDCFVAVTGLPDPREDHAMAMARFARDCMHKMKDLTRKLELRLGPGTSDLNLRIGLHSGQVTAGMLRGERSRFQLFGDTVNTCSRMETSSVPGRIHISPTTAKLLIEAGASDWVHGRPEKVFIAGKGEMETYWLETKQESLLRKGNKDVEGPRSQVVRFSSCVADDDSTTSADSEAMGELEELRNMTKYDRLVDWNVEMLSDLLRQILAARDPNAVRQDLAEAEKKIGRHGTILEECKDVIALPKIGFKELQCRRDPEDVEIPEEAVQQLRRFISIVSENYLDNSFHNFEHASHVTSSVLKLLKRIVQVDTTMQTSNEDDLNTGVFKLTDFAGHSYGITADPLTQWSVVLSAVIHDMQHPGIPNAQMVAEKDPRALKFKQSTAEQNSVEEAWKILMRDDFKDLRACIYEDEVELRRFRQLVVNVVMATDICDKELGSMRKARWEKAFAKDKPAVEEAAPKRISRAGPSVQDADTNEKATIVIEHLIQASDVSHTMQHWHVYRMWNERLFNELYSAYLDGRAGKDPSVGWYEGEIGFFDFYIIPLAKKLHSCGVFGVSSHEYLNYAESNRDEWKKKGKGIVAEYLAKFQNRAQAASSMPPTSNFTAISTSTSNGSLASNASSTAQANPSLRADNQATIPSSFDDDYFQDELEV